MHKKAHPFILCLRHVIALIIAVALLAACSTKKNTAPTRFYHATTAHYNTFFNGKQAYLDGIEAQYKGHKDDYTQLLPMYVSTIKGTQSMGKTNFETAITKCEKAIKVHSIKGKPDVNKNKTLSEKERNFLARKEFNPFLRHAWLLMAKSQFAKGDFIECASTCNYIIRLYAAQPEVAQIARSLLVRCYVALEWPYDAEDVLNKMGRDSIAPQAAREKDESQMAWLVATKQYERAIPLMQNSIKNAPHKRQRARLRFLLAQLYQETGNADMAYKTYSRVIRSSPPYEMNFAAQIKRTETVANTRAPQMIRKLRRMARSEKNKDYMDQVYLAMGNIYLAQGDTAHAIGAYEKGNEETKGNSPAKAVLLLQLSEIYWQREDYINAARTYQACLAALNREREEYEEVKSRSDALKALEPQLTAVHLQDSLQLLAKMDEAGRNAAIDRVIEALKKKEKEEAKMKAQEEYNNRQNTQQGSGGSNNAKTNATTVNTNSAQKGEWYFYNPAAIQQGKKDFQKQWGKRKNENNWRYSSKEGLPQIEGYDPANDPAAIPEPTAEQLAADSLERAEALRDSLENDPHQREYYLKEIPFSDEQLAASNAILEKALYQCGSIEQDKLENYPLAVNTLLRLLAQFPETANQDDIYYRLFLMAGRMQDSQAEVYKQHLLDSFPDSKLTHTIANPNFERLARRGKEMEDSVYAAAWQAYSENEFQRVEESYQWYSQDFDPAGTHHARMLFVRAMSNLYNGQVDTFMTTLKEVVQRYPKEEVTELAQGIVKGIGEGRAPISEYIDASNMWRLRMQAEGADTLQGPPTLSEERFGQFAFVLAYKPEAVDQNRLIFEMARYNFTNFMVRNFDLTLSRQGDMTFMIISGFQSYDEVHAYAQQLYADEQMIPLVTGLRSMLISEDNLKHIGTNFTFEEYKDFQEEKLTPIEVPEDFNLDEPTDFEPIDPENIPIESNPTEEETTEEEPETTEDDDFPFGF